MRHLPLTVVSSTLEGPLDWPDATLVSGDAVAAIAKLKAESDVPLRSHGSLSLYQALMAAGLVDRVQVTVFPVITGQTGLFRERHRARHHHQSAKPVPTDR
ncbi:dihydrofolate reductase family protein [Kribbella qitaiheensis]|uniref:dihydrofolate reductase family protein n=1 Tax=Kribbella qitaiheensis TaxID=1544730 RepID=UPI0031B63129